ncbi:hypothetical protein AYO38_01960 [bacterium SCGC AG-212-C10]|nr:hypothetical protein AYO38_01960 [bacterium SCGC AG-212-C10]
MVGAGLCISALLNGLYSQAYGAYVVLLREEYGWSKTMLSSAYSMGQAESGVIGPLQGWLTDRFGPRAVVRAGLVIMGAGFVGCSRIDSPLTFFLAFFVMSLGASMAGFLSLTVAVVNWFERKRALAIGLLTTGVAIGGLLVPLTVHLLENWGWRPTAALTGVIVIVVGVPVAQFLYHRPEDFGHQVDGGPRIDPVVARKRRLAMRAAVNVTTGVDFTLAEAARTRQFWLISLGHGSALLIVSAVTVHLVVHVHENLGYSLGFAGFVVALLTAAQAAGTIGGGYLGDRMSKRRIAIVCMFVHAAALLLLAFATATWMVVAFAIAHGLAWGVRGPLMTAIRADYFGRAHFGKILGASQPIVMAGTALGPILAGVLADRTGNYEVGFTVLAALAAAGSLFFVLATKPHVPVR